MMIENRSADADILQTKDRKQSESSAQYAVRNVYHNIITILGYGYWILDTAIVQTSFSLLSLLNIRQSHFFKIYGKKQIRSRLTSFPIVASMINHSETCNCISFVFLTSSSSISMSSDGHHLRDSGQKRTGLDDYEINHCPKTVNSKHRRPNPILRNTLHNDSMDNFLLLITSSTT